MTALLRPQPRHQPEPTRPRLRAVEQAAPAPARGRRRLGLISSGLLFSAVLIGNVTVHASITQGQFELERLQDTTAQRQAAYQQLRLQVAEAEAPQRVVERARRLGMVEPKKVTYLTPSSKTSSPKPSAEGASDPRPEAAQGWGRVKPHLDGRR